MFELFTELYKHKMVNTDWKQIPIPWSIHSSQASIQQSLQPITDKLLAIFLQFNYEGFFTSISNHLFHFTVFGATITWIRCHQSSTVDFK